MASGHKRSGAEPSMASCSKHSEGSISRNPGNHGSKSHTAKTASRTTTGPNKQRKKRHHQPWKVSGNLEREATSRNQRYSSEGAAKVRGNKGGKGGRSE